MILNDRKLRIISFYLLNKISFLGIVSGKDYYKRPSKEGHVVVSFQVESCVQREWVVGIGRLYECFWEQGQSVSVLVMAV